MFYLSFNIKENYELIYVTNRQNLNLLANLKVNKLNLPNGAYFYRTNRHYK